MQIETYEQPEPWKFIQKQITRSHIKRFKWQSIFGCTLTKAILTLKMQNKTAEETIDTLINDPTLLTLDANNPNFADELRRKIKISVYARYGENNSSLNLYHSLQLNVRPMGTIYPLHTTHSRLAAFEIGEKGITQGES